MSELIHEMMVGEYLPETDNLLDGPPASSPTKIGLFSCSSTTDSWSWGDSSSAWPDTFFMAAQVGSPPSTSFTQTDEAQRFGTGSSSSQSVSVNTSTQKVWKIVAFSKNAGPGFTSFDPIGYVINDADSLDSSDLESSWYKVDKAPGQDGIAVLFPAMPAGSYFKYERLSSPPSTLSFDGWVGADV